VRDCLGTSFVFEPQKEHVKGRTLSQWVEGQAEQDHKNSTDSRFLVNQFDEILRIHLLNNMKLIIH